MCDNCDCCHVPDHGACDTYEEGAGGRCVYCDHAEGCHPGTGEFFNGPLWTYRRDPAEPAISEIRVTDDIIIDTDIEDEWFAIYDRDNLHYDELGSVVLGTKDCLDLIKSLFILYHKMTGTRRMKLKVKRTADSYVVDTVMPGRRG